MQTVPQNVPIAAPVVQIMTPMVIHAASQPAPALPQAAPIAAPLVQCSLPVTQTAPTQPDPVFPQVVTVQQETLQVFQV